MRNEQQIMCEDSWWTQLYPPYSPSDDDVLVYKKYIFGTNILLLGSTKLLLPLATTALDIIPKYNDSKIKSGDWLTFEGNVDVVLADGALCLGDNLKLGNDIINHYRSRSKRIIARCFNRKLDKHRWANSFPNANDFDVLPRYVEQRIDYNFYIWDFK